MRLYAGRFADVSSYFVAQGQACTDAYGNVFGKRFPAVEEICSRFILEKAFMDKSKIRGPINTGMPISFATFLHNMGLSTEGRKGDEFLASCAFIEDMGARHHIEGHVKYLRQFNHFVLFALQKVPMDILEMELAHTIAEKARVDFSSLENAMKSIASADLSEKEKIELVKKVALYLFVEKQREQVLDCLDFVFMCQFTDAQILETLGIGLKNPEINSLRIQELDTEVVDVEGNLFYSGDPQEALERGIEWHRYLPEIFDEQTTGMLDFFYEARYSRYVYSELSPQFEHVAQA